MNHSRCTQGILPGTLLRQFRSAFRRTITTFFVVFTVLSTAQADMISVPQAFSGVQGSNGIFYEAIGDSRSTNTLHPGPLGATLMSYRGSFSFGYPGEVPHLTYASPGLFPHVQYLTGSGFLRMHPGTGGFNYGTGSSNLGAAIRFQAATAGLYDLLGGFARDNVNQGWGDGVDVLIVKGLDLDNPLFTAHISQNHAVPVGNPFAGSGVVSFGLQVPLSVGESIRFIVFSDAQGQDGTFDSTAFRVSIAQAAEVPEPATAIPFGLGVIGMWIVHRRQIWRCLARSA